MEINHTATGDTTIKFTKEQAAFIESVIQLMQSKDGISAEALARAVALLTNAPIGRKLELGHWLHALSRVRFDESEIRNCINCF